METMEPIEVMQEAQLDPEFRLNEFRKHRWQAEWDMEWNHEYFYESEYVASRVGVTDQAGNYDHTTAFFPGRSRLHVSRQLAAFKEKLRRCHVDRKSGDVKLLDRIARSTRGPYYPLCFSPEKSA